MGSPLAFLTAGLASFLIGTLSGLATGFGTWKQRPATARVVPFAFSVLGEVLDIMRHYCQTNLDQAIQTMGEMNREAQD